MKIFLCSMFLFFAANSFAGCSIDFENEVSPDPAIQSIFGSVKSHQGILMQKGFRLISAKGPIPDWTATISKEIIGEVSYLVMSFHSMRESSVHIVETQLTTIDTSVQRLLSKMTVCR